VSDTEDTTVEVVNIDTVVSLVFLYEWRWVSSGPEHITFHD